MTINLDSLLQLLEKGQDNPMLRLGIAKSYLDLKQPQAAIEHLQACLEQNPNYSAAWELLGKAQTQNQQPQAAIASYQQGIQVAAQQGDKQAEKEMQVFLKRLQKQLKD